MKTIGNGPIIFFLRKGQICILEWQLAIDNLVLGTFLFEIQCPPFGICLGAPYGIASVGGWTGTGF